MCKLFTPTPTRESLEELESRVSILDQENQKLELILNENLDKKVFFSQNVQVETLQQIIEDYEERCRNQDGHIAEYLEQIADLKHLCQDLMRKNKALKQENCVLKGKNYLLNQEMEKKSDEIKQMMKRSNVYSSSNCSTMEDISSIDFEEVNLEPCPSENRSLHAEFQETIKGLNCEIKRLKIEGLEEKEKTVTNFFHKTPVRVIDMESGFFKRNLGLLKMKVLGNLGFMGIS
jgi:regulator of replication initiation timing